MTSKGDSSLRKRLAKNPLAPPSNTETTKSAPLSHILFVSCRSSPIPQEVPLSLNQSSLKVLQKDDTLSDPALYEKRTRICDLGYLRHAYRKEDGTLGWRCPSEPVADYLRKGGDETETRGRKCVCNALMANIGLGQVRRDGKVEAPLVTSGDDARNVARFLRPGARSYTAADVLDTLLARRRPAAVLR